MELGSMDRQLADRPVEIHIRNPPCALILTQQVVEPRRLAVRLDDPGLHDAVGTAESLAGDLQLLARIAVKAISVSRCHIVLEGAEQLLLLCRRESSPARADG